MDIASATGLPNTSQGGLEVKSPDGTNVILARFRSLVESESFYDTADTLLTELEDPIALAHCAELASRREPGGTYYRAKLWAKTSELLGGFETLQKQKSKFGSLCTEIGVHPNVARNCILQGEVINSVEKAPSQTATLRNAAPDTFQYAQRQKDRAAEYLTTAIHILEENPRATPSQIHRNWCHKNGGIKANLDIIKPSDWWAFSHPKWPQEEDFPGSIPGEVYANALYYFAPRIGVAVDPMAGSGMLRRVYDDRKRWQKDSNFDLDVHLFDLHPRRDFIKRHDARTPLAIRADWIFIDPPYFGQSNHLFHGGLASTTNYDEYLMLLREVVTAMEESLNIGGRLCVFLPKWSGLRSEDPNYDVPGDIRSFVLAIGLHWIDTAFVSRGRQQERGRAIKNNTAKRHRRMQSDTCILNVFEKPG